MIFFLVKFSLIGILLQLVIFQEHATKVDGYGKQLYPDYSDFYDDYDDLNYYGSGSGDLTDYNDDKGSGSSAIFIDTTTVKSKIKPTTSDGLYFDETSTPTYRKIVSLNRTDIYNPYTKSPITETTNSENTQSHLFNLITTTTENKLRFMNETTTSKPSLVSEYHQISHKDQQDLLLQLGMLFANTDNMLKVKILTCDEVNLNLLHLVENEKADIVIIKPCLPTQQIKKDGTKINIGNELFSSTPNIVTQATKSHYTEEDENLFTTTTNDVIESTTTQQPIEQISNSTVPDEKVYSSSSKSPTKDWRSPTSKVSSGFTTTPSSGSGDYWLHGFKSKDGSGDYWLDDSETNSGDFWLDGSGFGSGSGNYEWLIDDEDMGDFLNLVDAKVIEHTKESSNAEMDIDDISFNNEMLSLYKK